MRAHFLFLALLSRARGDDATAAPTEVDHDPTPEPTQRPTWPLPVHTKPLNAKRAWRAGSDMATTIAEDLMDILYTSNPMPTVTQCFHGNELYLPERVLCDRQCMIDHKRGDEETASAAGEGYAGRDPPYRDLAEHCNGPWYCARTEICELFVNPDKAPGADSPLSKSCTVVLGCANHSTCFPEPGQAEAMHIATPELEINRRSGGSPGHQARWVMEPYELRYGGFTVKTTCCANEAGFERGVDMPCNSASGLRVGAAFLAALLALVFRDLG